MLKQFINDIKTITKKRDITKFTELINNLIDEEGYNTLNENVCHISGVDLYSTGYAIACVFKRGNYLNGFRNFIITDGNFDKLSLTTKRFVLLHEECHIVKEHYSFFSYRDVCKEHEADMYAVDKLGYTNSIDALRELRRYTGIFGFLEVNKRIRLIRRNL